MIKTFPSHEMTKTLDIYVYILVYLCVLILCGIACHETDFKGNMGCCG